MASDSEKESCDGLDILQTQENMNESVENGSAAVIQRYYGLPVFNNDNIAESDSMKEIINTSCTLNIVERNYRDTHDLSETTESRDAPDDEFSAIGNPFAECITVTEGIPNLCDVTTMIDRGDPQQYLTHLNQGSCDLKYSSDDGETIYNREPCDLQHQEPCDLQPQEPCDLQHQEPCDLPPQEPCDLQHQEPCDLQHRGPCDLQHREPCDLQHREPCDLQHREPCDLQHREPCDLQHREPCDLQHREPCDLQHQEPCDLQHWEPCDLQHQEPCDLQHREPCDLQHREPCDLLHQEPCDLQHQEHQHLNMGKKVCNLFHTMFNESFDDSSDSDSQQDYNSQDASDSDSQQDYNSQDASDSDSQQDNNSQDASDSDSQQDYNYQDASESDSQQDLSSSEEEGQSNPDVADVFNKFYGDYTEFQGENQCHQLQSDLAERVISIGRNILKCFNRDSMQSQDDDPDASSNFCFGSIVKDLLELFTRENGSESAANANGAGVETEQWINDVFDVIIELVDFWCHINGGEDNAANTEKNKSEPRGKKGTKVHGEKNLGDCVKTLITDTLKVLLWIGSGCKEVAAENYKAEDVWFCNDGSSSVRDLLSVVCLGLNNSDTASDLDETKYLFWITNWVMLRFWQLIEQLVRSVLHKKEKCPKDQESSFQAPADNFQWIFRLVHLVNENYCQLKNITRPDTDTKQPFEVIVSCLSSWFYSQIMLSDEDMIEVMSSAHACKVTAILTVIVCGPIIWLPSEPDEIGSHLLQGLEILSAISPHCEYFIRNILHIYLYWVLCILSNKLPFAEGTSMFGKRCLKEVSVLELLYFFLNYQETPHSGFTELKQIVTNLRPDFQIENISSRCIPDVFYDNGLDTQTEPDNECGSVVDLLWSRYKASLSQSNWCNAVNVVAKMIKMFYEGLVKCVLPEGDEIYPDLFMLLNCVLSVSLSGSRNDGCISLLPGRGNACDLDIMAPIFGSDYFIMESVQDRPVNIVFKRKKKKQDVDFYFEWFLEHDYVSPKNVKLWFNTLFSVLSVGISTLFVSPFHRKFNTAHSVQLGDVASTFLLFQGQDVIASADCVPAITIDLWPEQAHSWIHRKSQWPAHYIREAIAGIGCHAVPKTTKGGDPDKEWRLSFSKAENTLCKIFTPSQAFHLSLLKTQFQSVKSKIGSSEVRIFKNYSITKGEFHTYHTKTAMFWFCENHPAAHKIWKKENVYQCQSELLESMEGMMREGYIPHYFIPEQNLLEGVPMELLQQAAGELRVLKEEARSDSRVYQEIIKHRHEQDPFSQYLTDLWKSNWLFEGFVRES